MFIRIQADDFFQAYKVLEKSYDTATLSIMSPSVVCLAFATELYIKDIYCSLNKEIPRTHNILELFEGLEEPVRNDIFSHDAISQNPFMTIGDPFSPQRFSNDYTPYDRFTDQIKAISNTFIEWRYFYEQKRAALHYDSSFALGFIEALRCVADKIRAQSTQIASYGKDVIAG